LACTFTQDVARIHSQAPYEIALGEPVLIARALPQLPALRWVQSTWAGVEPLFAPGLRRDYILTNVRGVFGPWMSEYVFGYLLAHERQILPRWQAQQAGNWDNSLPGSLRGKRLGLLGVGSIGSHLAATARHFGMRVFGYTRASASCPLVEAYFHGDQLSEFARQLDYLVNTLPQTPETSRIVNAALLSALPSHAVFVNIGRGSAVDEQALAAALSEGRLAGAVLDVFESEPLPPEHIFWRTPNCILTAHTAAPSFPHEIVELFVENYQRWRNSQPLLNQVDFERSY
jgi:phosphoglycerate dehydrogenase-like enzyme